MSRPLQSELALARPRPEPTPRKQPPSPLGTSSTPVLRTRRYRLYRLVERTQATIAEIEAELSRRGISVDGAPPHRKKPLPYRHNELPRFCFNTLRSAGHAMHVREIAALAVAAKGLDPMDRAIADDAVRRVRNALALYRRKGLIRLIGAGRANSVRWALVDR
jgi:hypothetical protein